MVLLSKTNAATSLGSDLLFGFILHLQEVVPPLPTEVLIRGEKNPDNKTPPLRRIYIEEGRFR